MRSIHENETDKSEILTRERKRGEKDGDIDRRGEREREWKRKMLKRKTEN